MTATQPPPHRIASVPYSDLIRLFLRLSLTAFGGPVAHIAMAEDEIVSRRQWLTREHFLDLVAATNLIPGPNSTEVMIHVGYVTRGIPGALVAGACFIIPAFLLTLVLAVIYGSSGQIPQVEALLWGIKPVIVAIIAQAGYRLARTALTNRALWLLFSLCVLMVVMTPIAEVLVMIGAGLVYGLYLIGFGPAAASLFFNLHLDSQDGSWLARLEQTASGLWPANMGLAAVLQSTPPGLGDIFFYFLKIGSVLFGSGYVLVSYIQQDVVNRFGWLTGRQLLDAVAIGQITPGPVSTTVAVVGYIVAGLPGAVVATIGIFLPSFVLVILTAPLIPKMRQSRFLGGFLSGVNTGVIAAIGVTLVELAGAALKTINGAAWSPVALTLALVTLGLLMRFKVNATWLIALGAGVGLAASALGAA